MQQPRPLSPESSRAVLVVNGASRRGAAAAATAERLMRAQGWRELEVHRLDGGADLPSTLGAAVATAPDLLVVGGGDGSLSCGAGAVAGTEVVLGVLPLGTANDFARTLQVPNDLPGAVATLTAGHVVDIDLGRVGLVPYLNVASIGLSVGVTEKLSPRLKKRLGPLAYPVATLMAYRAHEPFSARLEFPDGDHEPLELHDLLQVAVGNGRHYGGGNAVSPTASLDDHLLDVYAIVRGRLRDHVSIARLLKDGSLVEHERVHHVATRRLRVVTDPDLGVNLDGEIAARTPADFGVERNAVHVVVPVHSVAAVLDGPGPSAADAGS